MSIAHDVSLGNATSSVGTATSLATTPAASPTAGAFIGGFFVGHATPAITDTQGNTYDSIALGTTSGTENYLVYFFYTPNPAAVTHTSNAVTATWTGGSDAAIIADSWTGVAASQQIDTNASVLGATSGGAVNSFVTPAGGAVQNTGSLLLALQFADGLTGITWVGGKFNGVAQTAGLGNDPNQPAWDACYQLSAAGGTAYALTVNDTGTAMNMYGAMLVISPVPVTPSGTDLSTDQYLMPGVPMPSLGGIGAAGMFAQPVALGGAMYMAMPRNYQPAPNNPLGAITPCGGYGLEFGPWAGLIP